MKSLLFKITAFFCQTFGGMDQLLPSETIKRSVSAVSWAFARCKTTSFHLNHVFVIVVQFDSQKPGSNTLHLTNIRLEDYSL